MNHVIIAAQPPSKYLRKNSFTELPFEKGEGGWVGLLSQPFQLSTGITETFYGIQRPHHITM